MTRVLEPDYGPAFDAERILAERAEEAEYRELGATQLGVMGVNVTRKVRECPICGQVRLMSRHHLTPKAVKVPRGVSRKTILICRSCHDRAHRLYGDGHQYTGPTDKTTFITRMVAVVRKGHRA